MVCDAQNTTSTSSSTTINSITAINSIRSRVLSRNQHDSSISDNRIIPFRRAWEELLASASALPPPSHNNVSSSRHNGSNATLRRSSADITGNNQQAANPGASSGRLSSNWRPGGIGVLVPIQSSDSNETNRIQQTRASHVDYSPSRERVILAVQSQLASLRRLRTHQLYNQTSNNNNNNINSQTEEILSDRIQTQTASDIPLNNMESVPTYHFQTNAQQQRIGGGNRAPRFTRQLQESDTVSIDVSRMSSSLSITSANNQNVISTPNGLDTSVTSSRTLENPDSSRQSQTVRRLYLQQRRNNQNMLARTSLSETAETEYITSTNNRSSFNIDSDMEEDELNLQLPLVPITPTSFSAPNPRYQALPRPRIPENIAVLERAPDYRLLRGNFHSARLHGQRDIEISNGRDRDEDGNAGRRLVRDPDIFRRLVRLVVDNPGGEAATSESVVASNERPFC